MVPESETGRIPDAVGGAERSRLHRVVVAAGLATGLVGVGVLLGALLSFLVALVTGGAGAGTTVAVVAVTAAVEAGYLALGVGYRELLWDGVPLGRASRRALSAAVAAGLALVALGQGVLRFVPGAGIEDVSDTLVQSGLDPVVLLALAAVGLLLVGPAEEVLFRGAVQGTLRLAFGRRAAIGGASVLFTAVHAPALLGEPLPALVAVLGVVFGVSVTLGYAYERTGGVAVPALVHGVYDAALLGVGYLLVG